MNKKKDGEKVYIYESHMGGFYVSDKEIPNDDLYCDWCENKDYLLFEMQNKHDTENLLIHLFKESYPLNEIFELIEQLKKYYEDDEHIEYRKETFINKIIQYATDLKLYDKTFKFDVVATFEDFKTKEIVREVNKKIIVKALNVELAMEDARYKIIIENFDLNDHFMKIKYNNIEVLDE